MSKRKYTWRSEAARKACSERMKGLHADPEFAAKLDASRRRKRNATPQAVAEVSSAGTRGMRAIPEVAARKVARRIVAGAPDECWPWPGRRSKKGYGVVTVRRQYYLAHRAAYLVATGKDPGDLLVCHTCDNPACVNPAHLWLGTNNDNTADRNAKGRQDRPVGSKNPNAILDDEKVRTIRASTLAASELADLLKCSKRAIYDVRNHKRWAHVT